MRSTSVDQEVLRAGLSLIEQGLRVFPLSSGKIPFALCRDCKAHGSEEAHRAVCECLRDNKLCHGLHAATDDPEVFRSWFELHPDITLLAIPTGTPTNRFVMEFDPKNGGRDSYDRWVREYGDIHTHTNKSPSGGLHHHFAMPNFDFGNIHGKLAPGIDIKSTGGYVLVPPSHLDGREYTNVDSREPTPAPKWLIDKIFEYQSRNKYNKRALKSVAAKPFNPDSISEEVSERVEKTIDYWSNRVRTSPDGNQNILIYTAARALFSLAFHGLVEDDTVRVLLEEAAEDGNHPPHRTRLALDSGEKAAYADPDPVEDALSNDINIIETFTQDDLGNATRVVFWRGEELRYDPDRERFHTWAEVKWIMARDGRIRSIVENVIAQIPATESAFYSATAFPPSEVGKQSPKTYQEKFNSWAGSQRYARKIGDAVTTIKGRKSVWCSSDDFDPNPYLFNVSNGVVDLRTGDLLPHDKSYMCSQISNVVYEANAKCPEFHRFLELTQPNPEHRKYLQRLAGYTLLGEVIDQIFALHIGSGGNGKGVFLDILQHIFGDYATTGQRDTFVSKSTTRIPADLASYEGKRFVLIDELNEGQKFNQALLKDTTGGGVIKAEAKNVNPWEYTPKFTLHFRTNYMPDLPSDRSIVRRFRPVKWTVEPTSLEWDSFTSPHHSTPFNFLTKQESSGILNWILTGCQEYLTNGLQVPEDLQTEALTMLHENDPFLMFMHEQVSPAENDRIDGTKLYKAYKQWYKDAGFKGDPSSSRTIYKDIKGGKYSGMWKWEMYRDRFHLVDVHLDSMLMGV